MKEYREVLWSRIYGIVEFPDVFEDYDEICKLMDLKGEELLIDFVYDVSLLMDGQKNFDDPYGGLGDDYRELYKALMLYLDIKSQGKLRKKLEVE